MDPFTEKLLERTRARRENLQKKMADRPTAANRSMAKRVREPLAVTNSGSELVSKNAPPSTKPSPSKRRCSDEKELSVVEAENREPPQAADPPTDKKPPLAPTSVRSSSSLERNAPRSAPEPGARANDHLQPPAPRQERGDQANPAAAAAAVGSSAIRSRLQRLAEQRQYWDAEVSPDAVLEGPPVSPPKSQRQEVTPAPDITPASSGTPLGRKGRLANLAATIGSWEDDLVPAPMRRDNAQGQPGTACLPPAAHGATGVRAGPSPAAHRAQPGLVSASKPVSSQKQFVGSPVKSTRVVQPSPQKAEGPESWARGTPSSPLKTPSLAPAVSSSPQKSALSNPPAALHSGRSVASSPQKAGPSTLEQVRPPSQSPLKTQSPVRDLGLGRDLRSSPRKPQLLTKTPATVQSAHQPREGLAKEATPLQQKGPTGTPGGPGVKSFLERFGERCQERSTQNSPSTALGQKTPSGTPPVTPNARVVQERLQTAQPATATADLALRQKQERENELAQIRNRFQRGNMWKTDKEAGAKAENEPIVPPVESPSTAVKSSSAESLSANIAPSPKSSTLKTTGSSPDEMTSEENQNQVAVGEIEMNVDGDNDSAVINKIFHGILEESQEQSVEAQDREDDDEEEDPLNISSMSLLTPLVETVAAVVRSPDMKVMTSTPASSFLCKTPDGASRPSKFQRARMRRSRSAESIDAAEGDDDENLPYSIDAYRSTRIKDTERPRVKQVIVRKEDVTQKTEETARSNHVNVKQKIKVLTNEMNMQQTVIHQASQALNCCTDEDHGKGSQVEAEAERLLLIATERRVALKAELDRLKGEGPSSQKKGPSSSRAQPDPGVSASKGSISLQELRLPLKADFVCSAAKKPESSNYYFFVMVRAGAENTVVTPLVNTRSSLSGDALSFTTKFTLPDVSNDFEIDVEVYCLVQKRELYSDKRKKPSKSKAITPKRLLTSITKSNLQTPVMASPGGPNAVRTSNFTLVGSHKLTLASIGQNKFPLEKVPFLCPLEGHVYLKLQCEVGSLVEERGFLTMFEDVSGFGAWHRRWCVLSGYCISYWTYPDDEKRKNPIGRINLANCTSRKVEPANREFCARPNTFELITVRPQKEDDKETLVSRCKNTMCVTKNWLSADTKDERNLWMQKLNQILVDLRMWQPDSCYRPV